MAEPTTTPNGNLHLKMSHDDENSSVDSNFDPEVPTIATAGSMDQACTLEFAQYDAATIRKEFQSYQSMLPSSDRLLQEQPSFTKLRRRFEENNVLVPRFLQYKFENGIKPHHALCCLLLKDYEQQMKVQEENRKKKKSYFGCYYFIIRLVSCGLLYPQLHHPADFIRDQFFRVADSIPTQVVTPHALRRHIRNCGLPIPNYFLDPEHDKQFPPHIALLVILQETEGKDDQRNKQLDSWLYQAFFSMFAFVALILRIVLEVIGGAGAIWGGAEVLTLRTPANAELWRWISVAIGVLCLLRFITLNAPQMEDEGDILGPAGPWSLRLPVRLRAVCEHPFHYFVRALPPSIHTVSSNKKND